MIRRVLEQCFPDLIRGVLTWHVESWIIEHQVLPDFLDCGESAAVLEDFNQDTERQFIRPDAPEAGSDSLGGIEKVIAVPSECAPEDFTVA